MRLYFILLCLPLLALDNSVTIREAGGASQAGRPTTIYRSFAQGEFAGGTYPKPRIDGAVPPAWQVDVKTAWPDGSVMAAYISFRLDLAANGAAVVDFVRDANPCHLGNLATCQAAALTQAQMLDYDTGTGAGTWGATWYGSVNSIEYSASARTMIGAGSWRYWLRGPVVTDVIVEDRSTALSHDFGWQYTGGVWAAPSSNTYKSLHPVYEVRFYPDPDGAGALTGWGGVEVDAQLWNSAVTRFQRINTLTLTLKTGNPEATTAYTAESKSFHARSRRHKLVWSGTAPGAVVIDHNFAYLIHTKLLPSYDYALGVAPTLADSDLAAYNANLGSDEPQWCDSNTGLCGNWNKSVGTTGARGDIALVARWYLHYLYLMGNSGVTTAKKKEIWDKLVIGNADAGSHAPIHYMESATGKKFFNSVDPAVDAFGRIISLDARPWWYTYSNRETDYSQLTYACTSSPCDSRLDAASNPYRGSWNADGDTSFVSHAPSFYSIPYMLTGYHYYLTGVQMEAAFILSTRDPCVTGIYCRISGRGIFYYPQVFRGTAWGERNVAWATILTPDGDIEKAYFKDRLKNNAAFNEGIMLLTGGAHTPANPACPTYVSSDATAATADMWCAGRYSWQHGAGGIPASNPTYTMMLPYAQNDPADGFVNGHRRAPGFWANYVTSVWAWIAGTGAIMDVDGQPMFAHLRDGAAAHMAGRVLYSPTSMYQMRGLNWGWGSGSTLVAQSFADLASSAIDSWTLGADMTDSQTTVVVDSIDWQDTYYQWLSTSWAKIDDEYVQLSGNPAVNNPSAGKSALTIVKRGIWGSAAAAHTSGATVTWLPGFWDMFAQEYSGGYPVLARASMALLAEAKQIGQCSPTRAYDVLSEALPFQNYRTNPQWAVVPRERIESVRTSGSGGTASLQWTAPTGEPCRVYVGSSPPASSSDASDSLATAPSRAQRFDASGLQAGTYHYRIGCRTARVSGTLTVVP